MKTFVNESLGWHPNPAADKVFEIQFSETQVLYSSTSPSFSNSSFNIKITDANGSQWTSSDGLTDGAGGSGIFFPKENLNFPLHVELEVYETNDFTGPSSTFYYEVESNSGNISDPNNQISMLSNQIQPIGETDEETGSVDAFPGIDGPALYLSDPTSAGVAPALVKTNGELMNPNGNSTVHMILVLHKYMILVI